MAPVFAAPKALERAGLTLADMDLVDVHEAFAAQVASNLQAMASKSFAEEHLGLSAPIGEVDPAKLNVTGGSIALGHPFAATGARMVLSTLRELEEQEAARAPHGLRGRGPRRRDGPGGHAGTSNGSPFTAGALSLSVRPVRRRRHVRRARRAHARTR